MSYVHSIKEYEVRLIVRYSPYFHKPSMGRLEARLMDEIPSWDMDIVSMEIRGMRR